MKLKEKTKDLILIIMCGICFIFAFQKQKQNNDLTRHLNETIVKLDKYKDKLKECDYAYTANHKKLDSLAKEHYKCYYVSYRTLENVKKLRRFVKENK